MLAFNYPPHKLFQIYLSHDQSRYLQVLLKYVTEISYAYIHAQKVSDGQEDEALALGPQIIAVLKETAPLT